MAMRRNGAPALHVVVSDQRRGAETFALDLVAELEDRGQPSPIVALRRSSGNDRLPIRTLGRRALAASTLLALRRAVAAESATVVVAHGSRTLPAAAAALAGTVVPFVYRSIGDPAAWSGRALRRWRTAALLRRARLVAVLWPGAAATLTNVHRVPPDRIRVVPNGVPAHRFPLAGEAERGRGRERFGLTGDDPIAVYVGSLTPEKDVGAAIAAVARVPAVRLLVAGAGTERAGLEHQAEATAPGRVRFVGALANAADAIAAADLVVLPSRTEGMPGVLIEAGLLGRPVVATDVGAVSDVVVDGETGLVVPPGDVAALATGIERALADDGSMAVAARARCLDRFDIGVVGARWAALLAEVLPR